MKVPNRAPQAVAAALLLATSFQVRALPIQLTSGQFAADIAGSSSIIVEDFEGMDGASGNPLAFANGTITSDDSLATALVTASGTFCGAPLDSCLFTSTITDTRTINALPTGTTLWGTALYFIRATDLIEITVTGGSGVLSFTSDGASLGGFVGFSDTLGIMSIAFHDLGTPSGGSGNYAFDNVTTASGQALDVAEPTTLSLLGTGLLLAFYLARRRRSAAKKRRA